jgi:hypothetical protein
MQTDESLYSHEPSQRDGFYILREENDFVAFEQERGCRFTEARFRSLTAAEQYVRDLRLKRSMPSRAKA